MTRALTLVLVLFCLAGATQGQELNKKLQREKAEFEAQIERERKYEETMEKADGAFKAKEYVTARMAYEEAIQYNAEKEQWLQSKVNDLDILMARRAARSVDSIIVEVPLLGATALPSSESKGIQEREVDATIPEVVEVEEVDSAEAIAETLTPPQVEVEEVPKEAATAIQSVSARDVELKPKAPAAKTEKTKVKEDFSSFENGVTEETFTLQKSEVVRIVVKEGIDVIIFKKVKHKWGGEFFFMDDRDVTRRYWEEQVSMYRQKYPSEDD